MRSGNTSPIEYKVKYYGIVSSKSGSQFIEFDPTTNSTRVEKVSSLSVFIENDAEGLADFLARMNSEKAESRVVDGTVETAPTGATPIAGDVSNTDTAANGSHEKNNTVEFEDKRTLIEDSTAQ